ncbi:MAG: winged helix-turn-helix domain-containing protein [Planctomycetaceae bacterium]|jgi:transposase|nr:winged helix-turn-helix domain-containing protein [Planctomycetaceae bacterium]
MEYKLSQKQIQRLRKKYSKISGQRYADRIRVVLALSSGSSASEVAPIFMLVPDTVRRYFRLYEQGGINAFLEIHDEGRSSFLSDEQKEQLTQHLRGHVYLDVKPVREYVAENFGVPYSISGMTKLLHELNFEYKKPHLVPGKANTVEQEKWVAVYEQLRKNAGLTDVFYFADGVHPQHNSSPA